MPKSSTSNAARSAKLAVECLEDRTTPTFIARPAPGVININGVVQPTGGLSVAAGDLFPDALPFGFAQNEYVTGTGPGVEGLVRIWSLDGALLGQLVPFPGFTGGINVAVGDVVGDGEMELITAVAANGPPHVKVFNSSGQLLGSFFAFDPGVLGGVNIAVGNVLGGIAAGGFSGGLVSSAFKQEIIIGAAAGGSPHVVATNATGTVLRSFLAFDLGYRGGVTVAAGSIDTERVATFPLSGSDTNSYDEIIVGAATAVPHVKAIEVWTGAITERLSFFAFDPAIQQGVTVAAGSTDNRQGAEIFVSRIVPPTSSIPPIVRVFNGAGQFGLEFAPFPPTYSRVVNMVVAYLTPANRGPSFYDPSDDDSSVGNSNFDFLTQDLAIVTGDGPFQQVPRYFIGLPSAPAGASGP
ncbi:MAG: hypothetical protein L0241_01385 [Planctomycetia bacterium]|nr:hypothetical protein [Planctomycetia bacterium]